MTVFPSKGEAPCCQPAARPDGPDEAAQVGSAPGTGGGSAVMATRGSGRRRSCGAEQVSFLGRTEPPARSPHLPAADSRRGQEPLAHGFQARHVAVLMKGP